MSEGQNKYARPLTLEEFRQHFLTEQPDELVPQAINYNTDIDWIDSVDMGITVVTGEESKTEALADCRNLAVIGKYLIFSNQASKPPGLGTIQENDEIKNTSKIEEEKEDSFSNLDRVIASLRNKQNDVPESVDIQQNID